MLKKLFEALEAAEAKTDAIDEMFEMDPENETLEDLWNEAYEEEHKAFEELVEAIVKYTNNQIESKTVRTMINAKREELKALFSKVA